MVSEGKTQSGDEITSGTDDKLHQLPDVLPPNPNKAAMYLGAATC